MWGERQGGERDFFLPVLCDLHLLYGAAKRLWVIRAHFCAVHTAREIVNTPKKWIARI
jgi:hypothetical protein